MTKIENNYIKSIRQDNKIHTAYPYKKMQYVALRLKIKNQAKKI